ncbi:MAG: hypothetical protein ACTSPE_05670 [Candidatus Thorarchaeota archaeon]
MKPPTNEPSQIDCGSGEYRFRVGDRFYYQFTRHGSVGIYAEFEIKGDAVKFEREIAEYVYPERVKQPGITGADKERVKWVFEAVAAGRSVVHVMHLFRGRIEEECNIAIIVNG